MNLEDLVPPLALCRKIPEGKFEDSALVWFGHDRQDDMEVCPREELGPVSMMYVDKGLRVVYQAPTLPEIMLALDEAGYFSPTCYRKANTWCVDCQDDPIDEETSFQPCLYDAEDDYNPATAAMKLWLEMEGIK